jgi:hypothetical protein
MRIKLTGFSRDFAAEITNNSSRQGITVTNEIDFDIEFIVDPKAHQFSNKRNQVLVLVEPEVVRPDLYRSKVWRKFHKVLPLSRYRAERLNLKNWFDLPVTLPEYKRSNVNRTNKWAIVNEHKFSASNRSQYGLRRKLIKYFESERPQDLDLYGVEWNKNKNIELRRRLFTLRAHGFTKDLNLDENFSDLWHNYFLVKGHMPENLENLQYYNYSLVIENDLDYISEKVWKSIYAGAVPIYVGPNLDYDKELGKVVISSNASLDEIKSTIKVIEKSDLQKIRENGYKFLSDLNTSKYSLENCGKKFIESASNLL